MLSSSIVHFRQTVFFICLESKICLCLCSMLPRVFQRNSCLLLRGPAFLDATICVQQGHIRKTPQSAAEVRNKSFYAHHLNKFIFFTHNVANSWPLLNHSFEYFSQFWCSLLVSVLTFGVSDQFCCNGTALMTATLFWAKRDVYYFILFETLPSTFMCTQKHTFSPWRRDERTISSCSR